MSIVVGGVSQLYQADLHLGRLAVERLEAEDLGAGVRVEHFDYGAVAVVQRLQELRPGALVLVGAEERGRPPGTVERVALREPPLPPGELRLAVEEAATGYITMDLVLQVGSAFKALPDRTISIEVEPARIEPSERLSPQAQAGLEQALSMVRRELERLGGEGR